MITRISSIVFCFFFLCLSLSACDDTAKSPTAKTSSPAKTKAKTIKTVPVETAEPEKDVYVYNPANSRDPFESPFDIVVEISLDNSVPLTPLQKFDLNQLRLIGLIIGKGDPRAMVIAPDGKSFIITKGVKVGRNNGSVAEITTDAIIVEEKYLDFVGDTKTRIQQIKLPKREE